MIPKTMKAVAKTRRARGAELVEVPVPAITPNEVLVKVKATAICGSDTRVYEWDGFAREVFRDIPNIMGHEMAGEVVAVGSQVDWVAVGDQVSAESHVACGHCTPCRNRQANLCDNTRILGFQRAGCFAEYIALPQGVVWKNSAELPLQLAAIQEPLGNAVYCTLAEPVSGQSVVIFGDGPIGLFAAAVAKGAGAAPVVLVGMDDLCLDIARRIGPDRVLDARRDSVVAEILRLTRGAGADVVLEMSGSQQAVDQAIQAVRKGGRYSAFGMFNERVSTDFNAIIHKGVRMLGIHGRLMFDTWIQIRSLLDGGKINVAPVITHQLALEEFERGFEMMLSRPRQAAKVLLYPDAALLPRR